MILLSKNYTKAFGSFELSTATTFRSCVSGISSKPISFATQILLTGTERCGCWIKAIWCRKKIFRRILKPDLNRSCFRQGVGNKTGETVTMFKKNVQCWRNYSFSAWLSIFFLLLLLYFGKSKILILASKHWTSDPTLPVAVIFLKEVFSCDCFFIGCFLFKPLFKLLLKWCE